MAISTTFIIRRRDTTHPVEDILLECQTLMIGRLDNPGLTLSHPSVSRTHAIIKSVNGEFWLSDISNLGNTYVNGVPIKKTLLAHKDTIQIGIFTLAIELDEQSVTITVNRQLQIASIEQGIQDRLDNNQISTVSTTDIRHDIQNGLETTQIQIEMEMDIEKPLSIYWNNRKREAGKIAEITPLHPHHTKKIGKAPFIPPPISDHFQGWRKTYIASCVFIFISVAILLFLIYENAYSPGKLSSVHEIIYPENILSNRDIALRTNSNICSSCHSLNKTMGDRCTACHTTSSFDPHVYMIKKHEGLDCLSCHTEHQGRSNDKGLLNYGSCSKCHNGSYQQVEGKKVASLLPYPHGGNVSYPVINDRWVWNLTVESINQKRLPDTWALLDPRQQFHAIHQMGRMINLMSCEDCHTLGAINDSLWRESPRKECAKCHSPNNLDSSVMDERVLCNACHTQHGGTDNPAKAIGSTIDEDQKLNTYLASLVKESPSTQQKRLTSANLFIREKEEASQNISSRNIFSLSNIGAIPKHGWMALAFILPLITFITLLILTKRNDLSLITQDNIGESTKNESREVEFETLRSSWLQTANIDLVKLKAAGPSHPYPVVNPVICIGCHACVDACPHDVLAMVNGVAVPVAADQCMEDTSCQAECPTNPKSCIVINTNKIIPSRGGPERDDRFKTNVDGIYLVGDISGVPLLKNAINEGAKVVDNIVDDLQREGANPSAEYDVAIIGIGPAGLSAAVLAKQRGLRYVAIEQDKIVATIQQTYPAGKYVFYKPDTVEAKGGIPLPGVGGKKEDMLQGWIDAMMKNDVIINEEESCKAIKQENGVFIVSCERGSLQEKVSYKVRKVIIAIGNRGTPMKLGVKGEDLKITTQPPPILGKYCIKCGTIRRVSQKFCIKCGEKFPLRVLPFIEDSKVKYRLTDPDEYVNKKCIVVGGGNSAIEAAVDLAGLQRDGDTFTFTRTNEVTLVIRSDFKGDLKLGNKMNIYDCIDAGKVKVFFRTQIKEISETEVVLMDGKGTEKARLANDYIFALIGGARPTKFLESIGIKVPNSVLLKRDLPTYGRPPLS
jgi:thioredoxin reductase (NADPH)